MSRAILGALLMVFMFAFFFFFLPILGMTEAVRDSLTGRYVAWMELIKDEAFWWPVSDACRRG